MRSLVQVCFDFVEEMPLAICSAPTTAKFTYFPFTRVFQALELDSQAVQTGL